MDKENKKFQFRIEYGIVILLIVLYLVLYIFSNDFQTNQKKVKEPIYVVINAKHQFTYQNEKVVSSLDWNEIYGTKKFYSYSDGIYLGQYSLMKYETGLYLFDENNNSVDYNGTLFTYSSPQKIETVNTNFVSLDAEIRGVVSEVARENNLVMPSDEQLTSLQKINVDLDGNGDLETIYSASSFESKTNPQQFSFVYYKDDGKLNKIVFNSSNDNNEMYYFSMTQAMDLDNDNQKELIIQRLKYQTIAVDDYMLYKYKGKEYQLLASGL